MMKSMHHSRDLHRGAAIVRQQLQEPSWAECDECTTEDDVWLEYDALKRNSRNSIEVDPPSMDDNWSVEAEEYSAEVDAMAPETTFRRASPEADDPPAAAPPRLRTTPKMEHAPPTTHSFPAPLPPQTKPSGGYISSEDDDDDEVDGETNVSDDIVEVDEPLSHPFYEPKASAAVTTPVVERHSVSTSSGSASHHARSPLHEPRNTFGRPSVFDYNVDIYCGYNVDDDSAMDRDHAVVEVPLRSTPGTTVSNLTTPDSRSKSAARPLFLQQQISSALMLQYDKLLRDPAYLHAQNAGFIWQSLVGQHIRFPSSWWNGARGPPMGMLSDPDTIPWMYFGRHAVQDHSILNQLVKCRASAGRLLLHIIVQDLMTRTPIQDICIGCFHPNAKGVRPAGRPALKRLEDTRHVWMAVRKHSAQAVAATDSLLYAPHHWQGAEYAMSRSPLGPGQRVTNANVRSVLGDQAPLETIFLSEDELYERLATHMMQQQPKGKEAEKISPPMAILQEFVFA